MPRGRPPLLVSVHVAPRGHEHALVQRDRRLSVKKDLALSDRTRYDVSVDPRDDDVITGYLRVRIQDVATLSPRGPGEYAVTVIVHGQYVTALVRTEDLAPFLFR